MSDILSRASHPWSMDGVTARELLGEALSEIVRLRSIIRPGDAAAYEESHAGKDAEIKRLREIVDDINNSTRITMDERCTLDEKHCTCVPILRAEIARLTAQLEATAENRKVELDRIKRLTAQVEALRAVLVARDAMHNSYNFEQDRERLAKYREELDRARALGAIE
jgi:hypothetical protein